MLQTVAKNPIAYKSSGYSAIKQSNVAFRPQQFKHCIIFLININKQWDVGHLLGLGERLVR
jgi:hypothetical protein